MVDVVVIGAGQAGIEAALASARMGLKTLCVTLRLDRIGHLPCNCSIGGPAKGHIAREVDALGGQMGVTTDYTLTHIRRVGTGKGPAVQTVRAQVCKTLYPEMMGRVLRGQPGLELLEGVVEWIDEAEGRVSGVQVRPVGTQQLISIPCRAAVVTTGTFLNGLCHEGEKKTVAAREGDDAVLGLSACLREIGVRMRRFKTGTTPRVRKSSLDLARCEVQPSEPEAGPLSFKHRTFFAQSDLLPCWQTATNADTHAVLSDNLHRSAMFSGQIQGTGPRYCPSVEDKIVRFADKDSHPIFLEQEEWHTESIYVQGFSTSMPADVQLAALRTVVGMEHVEMIRPGYAVEYDMADPLQLEPSLMSRLMPGLFLAGQINGTSGYEEAAGQGIVAGINAARYSIGLEPVEFPRTQSFIGVMIDDLVTKGVEDPYRMLTARAEHRLLLRHDNADRRLTPLAREIGLCDDERWRRFETKVEAIERWSTALQKQSVTPAHNEQLPVRLTNRETLFELMRRPEMGWTEVLALANALELDLPNTEGLDQEIIDQIELASRYDGYIQLQTKQAEQQEKLLSLRIPDAFAWDALKGLSYESREKLGRLQPRTVGQAAQVPGVRPSDIALLIGHLRRN